MRHLSFVEPRIQAIDIVGPIKIIAPFDGDDINRHDSQHKSKVIFLCNLEDTTQFGNKNQDFSV